MREAQRTAYCKYYSQYAKDSLPGSNAAGGGLRIRTNARESSQFAQCTDAVIAMRSFWPRNTRYYTLVYNRRLLHLINKKIFLKIFVTLKQIKKNNIKIYKTIANFEKLTRNEFCKR